MREKWKHSLFTVIALDNKVKGSLQVSVRGRGIRADNGLSLCIGELCHHAGGNGHAESLILGQLEHKLGSVGGQDLDALQREVHEGIGIKGDSGGGHFSVVEARS